MKNLLVVLGLILVISNSLSSKVVINEIMSSNGSAYHDNDFEYPDWIELYNSGEEAVSLKDWRIFDKNDFSRAWVLPDTTIAAKSYLIIHADNLDNYGSNDLVMESNGKGLYLFEPEDSFRYAYLKLQGNFEFRVNIKSYSGAALFGTTGICLRQTLEPQSSYFSISALPVERNHVQLDFRTVDKIQDWVLTYFSIGFPNYFLGIEKKDDSIFCKIYYDNYDNVALTYSYYLPYHQDSVYVGLFVNSRDESKFARSIFNNVKLDKQNIDISDLSFEDVNTTVKGRHWIANQLHTNFALSKNGETVYLFEPNGELVDQIEFPYIETNTSFGRFPNGSENLSMMFPSTPESANDYVVNGIVYPPSFTIDDYKFEEPIVVAMLHNDKDATIHYTVDGSTPNTSSPIYQGESIRLEKTTFIRAKAFKENYVSASDMGKLFIIDTGFTTSVLSLGIDPKYLNDSTEYGLYNPYLLHTNRRIPAHVEFIDTDGNRQFSHNVGLNLHGGFSRTYEQKSFRLNAQSKYGPSLISANFFGQNEEFNKLVIRNGGSPDWAFTLIKNNFWNTILEGNPYSQSFRWVLTTGFINGEYSGIYTITERFDEDWLAMQNNVEPSEINIFEADFILKQGKIGDTQRRYLDILEIDESEHELILESLDNFIDLPNWIEGILFNSFINNKDFLTHNFRYWNSPKHKLTFQIYDLDMSFVYVHDSFWNRYDYDTLSLKHLFNRILNNPGLKNYILQRSGDMVNTYLHKNVLLRKLDSITALIVPEIPRHQARYKESIPNWYEEMEYLSIFAFEREFQFLKQLAHRQGYPSQIDTINLEIVPENSGYIKLNTIPRISQYQWQGIYIDSTSMNLEALNIKGSKFIGWYDENDSLVSESSQYDFVITENTSLRAKFEPTNEIISDTSIVINEILYKPAADADTKDWIELYNWGSEEIDISDWKVIDDDDSHTPFVFPAGTIFEPNSFIVVCENLNRFRQIESETINSFGRMDFGLSSSSDAVRLFNSENEAVNEVYYRGNAPWPSIPADGYSIELISPQMNNALPQAWGASKNVRGTPGAQNSIRDFTSIEANDNTIEVSLYPNPTGDFLNIRFADNQDLVGATLQILSTDGKEYYNQILTNQQEEIVFNTKNLPAGKYFVKLKNSKLSIFNSFVISR